MRPSIFSHLSAFFLRLLWLAALPATCEFVQAAPTAIVEELKQAATAQGKLALGEIAAFKNTHLADITIQTPQVGADGSVSGTATFAGREAPVLLQYLEKSQPGVGQWLLAWRLPTQGLGDLIPGMGGAAGNGVKLTTPIVIFSRTSARLESGSLAAPVRDFYQGTYGGGSFTVNVEDGVNLSSAISVQGDVQAGLQSLGLNLDNLVLEGVVLKKFDKDILSRAFQDGRLTSAIAKDAELRAKFNLGRIEGLPADFQVQNLALLITGKPTVGVAFDMLIGQGADQRRFDCSGEFLGAGAPQGGKTGFAISARSNDQGPWRNALGIKGLEIHGAQLEIRNEVSRSGPPQMLVGVQGKLVLARKQIGVAGGVTTRKGAPSAFFRGAIDSLNRDDLVAIANDLAAATHGGVEQAVVGNVLPDFELRGVEILYAPVGGSEELGVPNGVGLKGQLYLFGSQAATVDALVDASSRNPRTSIDAELVSFALGPIKLHETKLDLLMAASTESHFHLTGGCDLLGARAAARANLTTDRSEVKMSGRLADLFEADVTCSAAVRNPSWDLAATFKNDFANSFQSRVSDGILAWARQAEKDFSQAQADLATAERDVNRINGDIAKAKAEVERDRKTNEAALGRAEADVNRINQDIAKAREQVKKERSVHLNAISKAEKDVDNITKQIEARRAAVKKQREKDLAGVKKASDDAKRELDKAEKIFQTAVAAWKKAKGLDKIPKGIDKDAKGVARDTRKVAYAAASKAYEGVRSAINAIPVDADPQIVALFAAQKTAQAGLAIAKEGLKKIHGTAPIDSDPRVAGLFVGRDTALAAVKAAQGALKLAHGVNADLDPRVAPLFVARDTALTSLNVAKAAVSATGDAVQWGAKATAAAASGQLLKVERAGLSGKVDVFQAGGKMKLLVSVRVMNEPRDVSLQIDTAELKSGRFYNLAALEIVPRRK